MAVGPPSEEKWDPPRSVGLPYMHLLGLLPKGNADLGGAMRRASFKPTTQEENAEEESCSDGFVVSSASTSSVVVADDSRVEATEISGQLSDQEKANCGAALLCAAINGGLRMDSRADGEQEAVIPNSRGAAAFSQQRRNCKLLRESTVMKFPEASVRRGEFRLLVEVISASNLCKPQYCVDDFTSGLVSAASVFAAVYVTVGIGEDQKLNTRYAQNPGGANQVRFLEEKLLFHYHGEAAVTVEVFDHREIQGVFGGDPLIGEAVLPLKLKELCAGQSCSCNLKLTRRLRAPRLPGTSGYVDGGTVLLRFQLVERPDRVGY
mmetsp:Transcript_22759/g.36193  ORF Transcript_22759/g.36193 Transcript_22759/m.36193 type:complete len:321 (-) Transcript_22759:37-999(-)